MSGVFQKILASPLQDLRAILKHTQTYVATGTEQSANMITGVAMIYRKTVSMNRQRIAPANRTSIRTANAKIGSVFNGPTLRTAFLTNRDYDVSKSPSFALFTQTLQAFSAQAVGTVSLFSKHIGRFNCKANLAGLFDNGNLEGVNSFQSGDTSAIRVARFAVISQTVGTAGHVMKFASMFYRLASRAIFFNSFCYSDSTQGVNLRNRFANWLGSHVASTAFEPLSS